MEPLDGESEPSAGVDRAAKTQQRWLLGFAVVLAVVFVSGVVWSAVHYFGCRGMEYSLVGLEGTMRMSDAVVEGEATYLRSVEPEHCVDFETYSPHIASVHFVADERLSDIPEERDQVPDLEAGDVIEFSLGLLDNDSPTTPALDAERRTFVLGYRESRLSSELPPWEANVVADGDERLQWWLANTWAAMDVGSPTAQSLATLMDEIRTVEAGGAPGPFEDAYAASFMRPSRAEQWLQTDPRMRSLDPIEVPAELWDEFVDVTIFVDLPEDLRGSEDDRRISVRSPSGIVLQASVGAGSGALPVLAMPGEAWELVELDGTGVDGTTIGHVPEQVWRGGYAVLLSVEERDGRLHATATPIDSAELAARMEAAADSP